MSDVDNQIMWLASVVCMPTRRAATHAAFDKMVEIGRFRAVDMPTLPSGDYVPKGFVKWAIRGTYHAHPVWSPVGEKVADHVAHADDDLLKDSSALAVSAQDVVGLLRGPPVDLPMVPHADKIYQECQSSDVDAAACFRSRRPL
jgi:hypothetical protein